MRVALANTIATAACLAGLGASPAAAAVDLVFRTDPQTVPVGARIRLELYAVSDSDIDEEFSAVDVGFTWDPAVLTLVDAIPGPHPWTMSGLLPDSNLDGINDTFADGDARLQAMTFVTPAVADGEGFLLATFRFDAIATTDWTEVVIERTLGQYSPTRVFKWGQANEDIVGALGTIGLTVLSEAVLSVIDLTIPVGRDGVVIVSGNIADQVTFGVTVAAELVPHNDTTGTVVFTPAPPVDIVQLGAPWPGGGEFSVVDSESQPVGTGSPMRNASVDSSGSAEAEPVTFAGFLVGFPIVASEDARGIWDVRLAYDDGFSSWEGLMTGMHHGLLKVVAFGDGDASETIDTRDYSELSVCFTGSEGPTDPPAYSQAPELRCGVYDFDGDGDIDVEDYSFFEAVMLGPAP